MAAVAPSIAKITRPRLFDVLRRERLFDLLDRRREYPLVWVSGPPGAGKTSLVASYLDARGLPLVWYQIDAGDADPAGLFYYLAQAARRAAPSGARKALPLLTPEYAADLPGFTRRFARELFSRLPARAALVFDNFQELPTESASEQVIATLLSEVRDGINLIVVSRAEPAPAFARALANRLVSQIGWDELRFTADEATAIASAAGPLDAETMAQLHQQADGWAAALVLLLERLRQTGTVHRNAPAQSKDAVFNYFASQLFDRASPQARHLLVCTAFLPVVTARTAAAISESPAAGETLEYLHRHHLFTQRRDGPEPSYQYHPLFRQFLLDCARGVLGDEGCQRLARDSARLLEARGQLDDAARLYRDSADHAALAQIVCRQAGTMLGQGRHRTLADWIEALPEAEVVRAPWLSYWKGAALLPFALATARGHYARAYDGFEASADAHGSILAVSAVLESYLLEGDDYRPADRWIDEFDRLLRDQVAPLPPEIEARVLTASQCLILRQPQHPRLTACIARAWALLRTSDDPQQRLALGCLIVMHSMWRGDFAVVAPLLAEIRIGAELCARSPLLVLHWKIVSAQFRWSSGDWQAAFDAVQEGDRIAAETGVALLDRMFRAEEGYAALGQGDLARAERCVRQLEASLPPGQPNPAALTFFLSSGLALLQGNLPAALDRAGAAVHNAEACGQMIGLALCRLQKGQVLTELSEFEHADEQFDQATALARSIDSPLIEHAALLLRADALLRTGETAAVRAGLERALALGREQGFSFIYPWSRAEVLPRLVAFALEAGIEVDHVVGLIRRHGWPCPSASIGEHWPWPIRIHTLGRFAILKDGEQLPSGAKAPRKTLDLLKALIAQGGRDVDCNSLAALLWPDPEIDGRNLFDNTLHRLRKLLGDPRAIVVRDGRVTLDARVVWVDVRAFEELVDRDAGIVRGDGPAGLERRSTLAFDLYQGLFLDRDEVHPWLLPTRERLRSKFIRHVAAFGERHENAGAWDQAIELYRRGIEVDSLAEDLYRRLMHCHLQRGDQAGALNAYRRCRETLSILLGVAPAPATQALRDRILRGPG